MADLVLCTDLVLYAEVSNWSRDEKTKPFPINISKNVDILSQTKTCGPLTASLKIVGNAKATSSVVIGVVASGSLVSVDKFGAYASEPFDLLQILIKCVLNMQYSHQCGARRQCRCHG